MPGNIPDDPSPNENAGAWPHAGPYADPFGSSTHRPEPQLRLRRRPVPRRDLLDQPYVAVGVVEIEERPVALSRRVEARLPGLDRERRAVPEVADLDAAGSEF